MAKVPVALRLDPESLTKVDAYAKARGVSRQRVMESFVESGLDDVARGVPDLVAAEAPKPKPAPPVYPAVPSLLGSRQAAINAMIDRARAR